MQVTLILKNGFRFRGRLLRETDSEIVLDEIKNGRMIFDKSGIIARNMGDGNDERGKHKALE
ncbi:MAG TPA: hypothetical protein HA254_02150 [Candidatus Diapherotrites archaeon]|uniref:Uncharacterized protein n=1 Tax=Candidatus Iainarchaeum sp. TaxID=3101447 RepID=A0A7J4IV81_9ARCH|nr:hypothetical protein [Candidatus Diapherotrites archaeon]